MDKNIDLNAVETWGRLQKRKYSDRVKAGVDRVINTRPEFDLERCYAEMKAFSQYKDEPRVIQRARAFETFLRDKTIYIEPVHYFNYSWHTPDCNGRNCWGITRRA